MKSSLKMEKVITALLFIAPAILCDFGSPSINPEILTQLNNIGECRSCKIFIESFKKGLERTARGKYEGGDAAWEEEKLKKSYKRSEMRLVDIHENICKEQTYAAQCHYTAEKAEEYIEEWWSQDADESTDLFSYICIEKLKVCCPPHHFGVDCRPCPGDHSNLCNKKGKCRGDGTRKGNGICMCDKGYVGDNCERCDIDYYETNENGTTMCLPCHSFCLGGCTDGTQKGCLACKTGFTLEPNEGCQDINECDDIFRCTREQFCMNSLGSYTCVACDKSCRGCYGDGPDMCRKCANGFSKKGELCIALRENEDTSDNLTTARYMTYVGLLTATGILLQKSSFLGGLVGTMVVSYIFSAEYYCMINGHTGLIDLKQYDLMRILRT